jgi:GNAT superfamily N-acetyltransferase
MALWRIRATVDDRPGYLSVLTASLALRAVNILAVQVHTTEAGAVDDFLVDTPDTMTERDLLAAVDRGRGRDAFIARAEAQGLADQPTRALALAGRLVRDPESLGEALAGLLDAADVTWRPDGAPGLESNRMRVADPAGGVLDIAREAPAFTPAEYARAQALVEIAATVHRVAADHATLLLTDGSEVDLRPAAPDDLAAVRDLHGSCPAGRYPGAPAPRDARLRRLLEPGAGVTLLAWHDDPATGDEQVVAMATLRVEGDLGDVSLLLRDGWHGRGLGPALLRRLSGYAARGGLSAVTAYAAAGDTALLDMLHALGGTPAGEPDSGLVGVLLRTRHETPATAG